MTKTRTLTIATLLLMALDGAALAKAAPTAAPTPTDAECNQVFKAKAAADKTVSSHQLARDLKLPIKTVNACLLRMRRVPRTPPAAE